MMELLIKLGDKLDTDNEVEAANKVDYILRSLAQNVQQATHLLTVSGVEIFGQARWDARFSAVETGVIEKTFTAKTEDELKKQVLAAISGKVIKISSSVKNDQPIILDWGIPYQKNK